MITSDAGREPPSGIGQHRWRVHHRAVLNNSVRGPAPQRATRRLFAGAPSVAGRASLSDVCCPVALRKVLDDETMRARRGSAVAWLLDLAACTVHHAALPRERFR